MCHTYAKHGALVCVNTSVTIFMAQHINVIYSSRALEEEGNVMSGKRRKIANLMKDESHRRLNLQINAKSFFPIIMICLYKRIRAPSTSQSLFFIKDTAMLSLYLPMIKYGR